MAKDTGNGSQQALRENKKLGNETEIPNDDVIVFTVKACNEADDGGKKAKRSAIRTRITCVYRHITFIQ